MEFLRVHLLTTQYHNLNSLQSYYDLNLIGLQWAHFPLGFQILIITDMYIWIFFKELLLEKNVDKILVDSE
jgi:hypothetical protein